MTEIHRYKLTIEYYGTGLVGWQLQDQGTSVQGIIEEALYKLCQHPCRAHAAGRTDAGVHASAMVIHIDLPKHYDVERVMHGLNYHMKHKPVVILDAVKVGEEFHARFSAYKRYYRYHIISRPAPLALMKNKAWWVKYDLDVEAMHEAAQILVGKHDFTTFRSVHCQSNSPLKSLDQLDVSRDGQNIYIDTSARSYLHHQVRSMVGALSFVGSGKWTKDDLRQALLACDRQALPYNAPPDGLYFTGGDY